jgi:hypothetical protein
MNAPLNILAGLASYAVKAVIENGRVRLLCPKDNPPPAELIEAARAHKDELHQLLAQEARCDRFEERAAILEFDEGLSRAEAEAIARQEMMAVVYDDMQAGRDPVSYAYALAALRAECPAYVDAADWQQAIEDGHRFVTQWGKQAEALGWAPDDLFGLHTPPEKPAPNYRRLSRYDQTGLVWLLHGRRVVELTKDQAVIETPTGTVSYRRNNKPALGPLGDSLDDFAPTIAANKSDATTVKHHGLPRRDDLFLWAPNV